MTEKLQPDIPEPIELNLMLAEGIAPADLPPGLKRAMRERLLARVSQSLAEHAGLLTVRREEGGWQRIARGIRIRLLWHGPQGNSILIELAPGTALPVHRHLWVEEGIVLRGEVQIGELTLVPFDYQVSPAGSRHAPIRSREGALAFLRGTSLGHTSSLLREIVGGIWPRRGEAARTVFAAGNWIEVAQGVQKKALWSDGKMASCFFRLAPGTRLAGHLHPADEECLMLAGELFLGDVLLRQGDYQLASAGSRHGEVYTDVGALLYVRGAAIC